MSALASKDHVITPKADLMSIDQKITFEMDNIEEKLQRMLQNRADAIDRELQERWPKMQVPRRADDDVKDTQRHCLQPPNRLRSIPPTIVVDGPRLVAARPPSNRRVGGASSDQASLDRALATMRVRVGASPPHRRPEPSWRARFSVFMSRVRTMPGLIDLSPWRSSLARVLEPVSARSAWSATLMMRFSRWSGGKRYG